VELTKKNNKEKKMDLFERFPHLSRYTTDKYYDDIRISCLSMKNCATNPPTFAQFDDDGSSSTGVFVNNFSVADTVYFSCQLPHTYVEGTDIVPALYWSFTGGTTARAVKWEFEYTISNPSGAFSTNTTLTDTSHTVALATEDGLHMRTALDTITGTSSEISAMILCRLTRITNGGDEYEGTVSVFEVDFHYEKNAMGSSSIYAK
jgi:hypothetical protein